MIPFTSLNASDARKELYTIIKSASRGIKGYEIHLRGSEPVILVSKAELESWLETIDVLMHKEEAVTIRKARAEKKSISHDTILKTLKLSDET